MKEYRQDHKLTNGQILTLRSPEVSDGQGLINQIRVVDCETKFLVRESDEFNLTLEQEEGFIRGKMENEQQFFIVAEIEGVIVGTCSAGIVMNFKRFLHRASMGIAIRQANWRMGIGNLMMQTCVRWCKDKGIEQLELEVMTANNRAIAMYKKIGFQVQATKKHVLKYSDGSYADEHLMVLYLNRKNNMNFEDTLQLHLQAMVKKDLECFMGTVSKESITLIMPNGALIKDYEGFYDLHKNWFEDDDWSINYNLISRGDGDEMSTALLSIEYLDCDEHGKPINMDYYLNLIFKLTGEGWKLIHDQNTIFNK